MVTLRPPKRTRLELALPQQRHGGDEIARAYLEFSGWSLICARREYSGGGGQSPALERIRREDIDGRALKSCKKY